MPNVNGVYLYPHPDNPRIKISRQRLHQLRNKRKGKCQRCGRRYSGKYLCTHCYPRRRAA